LSGVRLGHLGGAELERDKAGDRCSELVARSVGLPPRSSTKKGTAVTKNYQNECADDER